MNSKRVPAKAKIFPGAVCAALLTCVIAMAGVAAANEGASKPADLAVNPSIPDPSETMHKLASGQVIEVNNPYGNVYLRFGGYEHKLTIRSMLQQPEGAAKIEIAAVDQGARLLFAPKLPDGVALAQGQRLDVALYVPEGHQLRVATTSGEIESRGVRADQDLNSTSGVITVWVRPGVIVAATSDAGDITAYLYGKAPAGSRQRIATRTGSISAIVPQDYDADVSMSTSGAFTTEFSLSVAYMDGSEPDKHARVSIGRVVRGDGGAALALESLRGDIRIMRQAVFVEAADPATGGANDLH